ncbi:MULTISPECIES: RBBP9/YdeN family alpha/beta hydrolase [Pseudovibrio]|uniref:RBBP9/YdeN family alpha/beta hydrolase n=1 Tax=Stappiaceae TaxID=2821832 RepID=UPI0023664778|nr:MULTISPECIES: alpha/beta hydrolase [Pseudovibrio]MDD7911870.1 alpha/beta hydrolase [Pseudovibrio exalbescens]MDX5594683.1 alpha/beta hydrolase [Pseudovibrio sp. SPO723]
MKISEAEVLIVPGWQNSGPDHWQSRWQAKLSTARRVEQQDWELPQVEAWVDQLVADVEKATKPVVLVAHSLGVATVVHAAPKIAPWVKGAYLVACPDVDDSSRVPECLRNFGPLPTAALPFHAHLTASRNDPYCTWERSEQLAKLWGIILQDAGETGHLNEESGQGPWPEGLISFAHFMKAL